MCEANEFPSLIRRIRNGDEQAAADLVRRYEPLIRREIRLHLEDQQLGRLFDSMDICQSVLASFFLRMAAGQYDLDHASQLVALLVTMARNKLASAARAQRRQRRDYRRLTGGDSGELDRVCDPSPTPRDVVANRELLERFREELTAEERELADLRSRGYSWADIAARLGGTPQARRMQLSRGIDRAVAALGLEQD